MKKILLIPVLLVFYSVHAQRSGILTFDVGEACVTLLSDGQQRMSNGVLVGATPEVLARYAPDGDVSSSCNAFLVQLPGGRNILIDTGSGARLSHKYPLGPISPRPDRINEVMLTHLHGDHTGGLLDADGKPRFPNAAVKVSAAEYDYWSSDSIMNAMPAEARGGFESVRKMFRAYDGRIELFEPWPLEGTLPRRDRVRHDRSWRNPEIRPIAAYGHTPGHTMYMVSSGDDRILIWGDLTHAMAVQMPHPEISVTYDVDPAQAAATRARVLEYVAREGIHVAGMHTAWPAIGTVSRADTGYTFTPTRSYLEIILFKSAETPGQDIDQTAYPRN